VKLTGLRQILELWLLSTIILGALIATLIYANLVLLIYHAPTSSRPLDSLFIHVPARMFLLLPLNILFWQSLLYMESSFSCYSSLMITPQRNTWTSLGIWPSGALLRLRLGGIRRRPSVKLTRLGRHDFKG
jgi:hypothetical protein